MADQNARARALLADRIDRIRSIPDLAREAAPEIAAELRTIVDANIAAGRGPDGRVWPKTKDGKIALRGASKALSVKVIGTVILVVVDGVEARHDLGAVRGGVKRQIVPSIGMPAPFVDAIDRVLERRFAAKMGDA